MLYMEERFSIKSQAPHLSIWQSAMRAMDGLLHGGNFEHIGSFFASLAFNSDEYNCGEKKI